MEEELLLVNLLGILLEIWQLQRSPDVLPPEYPTTMRTVKMGVLGCRRRQASHVEAGRNSRDAASRTENDTHRERTSGPALPHSHVSLKGRYDTAYSLSGRIMRHVT